MNAVAFLLIFAGVLSVWSGLTGHGLVSAAGAFFTGKNPASA